LAVHPSSASSHPWFSSQVALAVDYCHLLLSHPKWPFAPLTAISWILPEEGKLEIYQAFGH